MMSEQLVRIQCYTVPGFLNGHDFVKGFWSLGCVSIYFIQILASMRSRESAKVILDSISQQPCNFSSLMVYLGEKGVERVIFWQIFVFQPISS